MVVEHVVAGGSAALALFVWLLEPLVAFQSGTPPPAAARQHSAQTAVPAEMPRGDAGTEAELARLISEAREAAERVRAVLPKEADGR